MRAATFFAEMLLCAATVVACTETPGEPARADPDGIPHSMPPDSVLQTAQAVPFFGSPVAASDTFGLTNFFDHQYPLQFVGGNGFQVTWWNGRHTNIDGHSGYDWVMPTGTQLYAVAAGRVWNARVDPPFFCTTLGTTVTDQLFVEIAHDLPNGERVTSVYVHLSTTFVQAGDTVDQNDAIGLSGNAGCSTEPHLHFHVWRLANTNSGNPVRIDPYGWRAWNRSDPWAAHPDGAASLYLWIDPPPLCVGGAGGTCYPTRYDDQP